MVTTPGLPAYSEHARHWLLSPNVCFLNHGSFGACPVPVLDSQRQWRDILERQPVRFFMRRLEEQFAIALDELAAFVGADSESVAFVSNATEGVNTVLAGCPVQEGDEWLVTDQEYNASANALKFWAERRGAVVRVVSLPFPLHSADQVVEAVVGAVGERTKLVLLDHITSQTGLVIPLERIVPALRERGVECLIDGAHGLGMVRLDLDELGAAYYTSNAHKWLCCPKGSAFLYVREDLREGLRPLAISHGANSRRTDRSRFRLEFDWTGTGDPTPWLAVPQAIRFLRGLFPGGFAQLRAHNRELVLHARERLCELLEIEPPAPEDMIGSLASVPVWPRSDGEGGNSPFAIDPLQEALYTHRIEIPVNAWPAAPQRVLRVSAQAYNSREQMDYLVERLGHLRAEAAVTR